MGESPGANDANSFVTFRPPDWPGRLILAILDGQEWAFGGTHVLTAEQADADGIVRIHLTGEPGHADYAALFRRVEMRVREPGARSALIHALDLKLLPSESLAMETWEDASFIFPDNFPIAYLPPPGYGSQRAANMKRITDRHALRVEIFSDEAEAVAWCRGFAG